VTAWHEFSPADFDARKADRRALRQARQAAETGQAGLFFVATPEREAKRTEQPEQLPGQLGMFSDDTEGTDQR
jgi:hypothetical protein